MDQNRFLSKSIRETEFIQHIRIEISKINNYRIG